MLPSRFIPDEAVSHLQCARLRGHKLKHCTGRHRKGPDCLNRRSSPEGRFTTEGARVAFWHYSTQLLR